MSCAITVIKHRTIIKYYRHTYPVRTNIVEPLWLTRYLSLWCATPQIHRVDPKFHVSIDGIFSTISFLFHDICSKIKLYEATRQDPKLTFTNVI